MASMFSSNTLRASTVSAVGEAATLSLVPTVGGAHPIASRNAAE
jgi:hypothetical protein